MNNSNSPTKNIKVEAENNYRSNLNTDNFRDMYRIKAYTEYANNVIKQDVTVFLDINNEFLDTYKNFILSNCEIKEFQPRWQYKPNYLSYDMYGTQSHAYILMYINDVTSILDFDFDYVKVPTSKCISDLIVNNQRLYPDRNLIKEISFA